MSRFRSIAIVLVALPALLGQRPPAATEAPGSKIWVGRNQEFEEYLRTAECVSMEAFPTGNTTRCTLRPGGLVARMAWRSLPPGPYRGFREYYKAEIAAYEVDKLLKLDMVPPTVGRQLQGTDGAAQLWVENVVDGRVPELPGASRRAAWEAQTVRMIMFDNLIGNKERNRANMLRDAGWNLILIDHSRAFGTGTDLPHKMTQIDADCWARIDALTRGQLEAMLGRWLDESEIRAILDRRDRMRTEVKLLPRL